VKPNWRGCFLIVRDGIAAALMRLLPLAFPLVLPLAVMAALAACAPTIPPAPRTPPDAYVPPFARVPYAPISRAAVVAVALREWRLFGSPVDDDPPGSRPAPTPDEKPEREEGLWQRVGEYWWLGMNAGSAEAAWTGKHDENGAVFPADEDGNYAWSAAFVSYVMRIAGAARGFPYSASHSTYIDIAKQVALGEASGWIVSAARPESYAPLPGDLICLGRGRARSLRYDDLPAGAFPGHCDIVVDTQVPGTIAVVGGNVDDAVTMKHVPVTPDGMLATPDGTVLDQRYGWMVVLRLLVPASVGQGDRSIQPVATID
jgi:Uncharacterized protein conserved in bacteria (DUF2272)